MAYTIISQNNSTTTLSDGVNTITVPSRVNLTSGNFTIVEVNNNMATLEDGDGNVYRDIPCVATLAGEGGGGGSALPDQTGHSGEFLTTDGTDASWAAVNALPSQTGQSGKFLTTDGSSASWGIAYSFNSYSGTWGTATGSWAIGLGDGSQATGAKAVAIGQDARGNGSMALALGYGARVTANNAIQLNTSGVRTNSDASTFKVGNVYGNFEIMSADGTIPTARFTTDPVSDGTYVPTLTISSGVATRSWSAPSGGLPSQTGNSGKFLTTDGTDASWATLVAQTSNDSSRYIIMGQPSQYTGGIGSIKLGYKGFGSYGALGQYSISIGDGAYSSSSAAISLGQNARAGSNGLAIGSNASTGQYSIACGYYSSATATGCVMINLTGSIQTNSDANTVKIANANGNFEMMSADGTIPAARHAALPAADGTYTLQLVITDGVPTLSWVAA